MLTTPPYRTAQDIHKRTRLRAAQALAAGLLALAAGLYILSWVLVPRYPVLRYVAAFSQAAMVGALADWFAVVALFRHPLGIRLPHTAIIPANKARIANNLGTFIQSRFLSTDKVVTAIRSFAPGRRFGRWLQRPENVAQLIDLTRRGLQRLTVMLDEEPLRQTVQTLMRRHLAAIDGATVSARLLTIVSEDRRHQVILDEALLQLHQYLQNDEVRDELVRSIARNIEFLPSTLNIDERFGRIILQRLYAALQTLLQDVRADRNHTLRRHFDETVADIIFRLQHDTSLRAAVHRLQIDILEHREVEQAFERIWDGLRDQLAAGLRMADSPLSVRVGEIVTTLAQNLARDYRTHQWIDDQILQLAPPIVTRYRRATADFIAAQVKSWNDEFMVEQIELNIGRDLQFIRVNGTLVGGAVGLIIYAATQWFR